MINLTLQANELNLRHVKFFLPRSPGYISGLCIGLHPATHAITSCSCQFSLGGAILKGVSEIWDEIFVVSEMNGGALKGSSQPLEEPSLGQVTISQCSLENLIYYKIYLKGL